MTGGTFSGGTGAYGSLHTSSTRTVVVTGATFADNAYTSCAPLCFDTPQPRGALSCKSCTFKVGQRGAGRLPYLNMNCGGWLQMEEPGMQFPAAACSPPNVCVPCCSSTPLHP